MVVGNKTSFKNNPVFKKGETVTRRRRVTTTDSNGGVIAITNDDKILTVIFNNINAKDLKIHDMGLAVLGNKKIFFDADQDIIEGDILIDSKEIKWYVETILSKYEEVYSMAIVKNISLKGSE